MEGFFIKTHNNMEELRKNIRKILAESLYENITSDILDNDSIELINSVLRYFTDSKMTKSETTIEWVSKMSPENLSFYNKGDSGYVYGKFITTSNLGILNFEMGGDFKAYYEMTQGTDETVGYEGQSEKTIKDISMEYIILDSDNIEQFGNLWGQPIEKENLQKLNQELLQKAELKIKSIINNKI